MPDESTKSAAAWARLFHVVPALDSLRTYSVDTFRRDLIAGLTVAAVAVPQAMAYASIVGLPVQYGLYTAMVMTAVGALFDSSKQLINGPTNAISIAVLSAIAGLGLSDQNDIIAAAVLMALMIGIIQTGIALLRLGDLTRYISHAVIVGFTTGASVLLLLDQIKNLLGLAAKGDAHDHFLVRLWRTLRQDAPANPYAVAIGLGTILFVLFFGWINRRFRWRVPELLLGVMLAAAVVWAMGLDKTQKDDQGNVIREKVSVIGKIPQDQRLPKFQIPQGDWSKVRELSGSALAIGVLGLLEAMAMAKAIAARTGQRLDMNQQCLSEGLANTVGSFFQCYPGSGSLTRSAINHQAGGVTQWSGVVSAIAVGATVLLFAPYAYYIPKAALAGILMVSAFRMIDAHKLAYHMRVTRMDAVIVLATAISAVAVSVEFCILIGTFVSFLIYLPRAARISMTELVLAKDGMIRERIPADPPCNRILIYSIEGELFFGSSGELETELAKVEGRVAGGVRVVLLRLKYARNVDGVCLDVMERFIQKMTSQNVTVILCGVRGDLLNVMQNVGWEKWLGPQRIFAEGPAVWSSTFQAVDRAYEIIGSDRCSTCPLRNEDPAAARSWNYMI
ncbi:MAG: SulP family inorganic anion transporter [Planctomycetales bacterium]|nr:SulP family inorganic anion transporter [Planctomycetales bacterium]